MKRTVGVGLGQKLLAAIRIRQVSIRVVQRSLLLWVAVADP